MSVPLCKRCKKPCEKYGGVGGYSVQCKACNEHSGVLRRASYARNHPRPQIAPPPPTPVTRGVIYRAALQELYKERAVVQSAIDKLEAIFASHD